MKHLYLKNDLERNKLEISQELEEQNRIISDATIYAKRLETALSAVNLALGTMSEKVVAMRTGPNVGQITKQ